MRKRARNHRLPTTFRGRLSSWLVLSTVLTLGASGNARAGSLYWDGTGTSWKTVADWSTASGAATPDPLAVPGFADIVIFNTSILNTDQTVALDAAQSALGLVFNSTGLTTIATGTGTNALTIATGGIVVNSGSGADTISASIVLGGTQSWTNNSSSLLTASGSIATAGYTATFAGIGNTTISGSVTGSGGLTMSGTGTLTLSTANTYGGATNITSGVVAIGNTTSLGTAATANVAMSGTGTLGTNNVASVVIEAISGGAGNTVQNGGSVTNSILEVRPGANQTATFAGTIQDGGAKTLALNVNGPGSLTLSGNNTHTGGTSLLAGRLNINSTAALGNGVFTLSAGIIDNTSGSPVTVTNNVSGGNAFTFGGTNDLSFTTGALNGAGSRAITFMGNGGKTLRFDTFNDAGGATTTLTALPGSNSTLSVGTFIASGGTGTGNVTLAGNANWAITGGISATATTGTMGYTGSGTLTLSGTSNYTGVTTLTGTTLILDASVSGGASLATTGNFTLNGATFIFKGDNAATGQSLGNVVLGAAGAVSSIQVVGGSLGTTLTLGTLTDATNNTMMNIKLTGNAAVTSSTAVSANGIFGTRAAITVTVGGVTEFAGKSGTSIVPYTGQTPFTGTTSGTATNYAMTGSQTLATPAATPNTIKITTSANDQSLDLGANTMKITDGGILFTGTHTGYEIKGTNPAALSAGLGTNSDLIIHNFGTGGLKISAVITNGAGAQTLSLDGTGTTTLSAANLFTGAILAGGGAVVSISNNNNLGLDTGTPASLTLNNATLQINSTNVSLSGTGGARAVIINGAGGTFDTNGFALTVAGGISGAGSLTKTGSGTLLLTTVAATHSGGFTNVQNGTLQVGGNSGLGTSFVTLGSVTGNTSGILTLGDSTGAKTQIVSGLATLGSGTGNALVGGNASTSTLTFTGNAAVPSNFGGSLGGGNANENNLALSITTGQLTLSGAGTYTGGTSISGGVLNINSATAIGSGALTITGGSIDNTSGGGLTLANNNAVVLNGSVTFGASNSLNFGATSTVTQALNQIVTLLGSNSSAGRLTFGTWNITAAAKALTVSKVQGSGATLNIGTLNLNSSATAGTATILNGNGNVNVTNVTETAAGTALTYSGTGTLTLAGTGSYTGGTTVSSGKVIVSGSIAGSVQVAVGAALASGHNTSSSIAGDVVLLGGGAGSTLAPGNAGDTAGTSTIGRLNVGGNLTLGAASAPAHLAIEIGGTTGGTLYDQVQVAPTSIVTLTNANLDLSLANSFDPTTATGLIVLIEGSANAISGTFANAGPGGTFNLGGAVFTISYQADATANGGAGASTGGHDVALIAVPEPDSMAMIAGCLGVSLGLQRFRRCRGLGWASESRE